jgi:hypothetical protein
MLATGGSPAPITRGALTFSGCGGIAVAGVAAEQALDACL